MCRFLYVFLDFTLINTYRYKRTFCVYMEYKTIKYYRYSKYVNRDLTVSEKDLKVIGL